MFVSGNVSSGLWQLTTGTRVLPTIQCTQLVWQTPIESEPALGQGREWTMACGLVWLHARPRGVAYIGAILTTGL